MSFTTFKLLKMITGVSLKIDIPHDIKLPNKFIIMCNHQSLIDIPFIYYILPKHKIKFVVRKGLSKYIPLISMCIRTGKHAIINQKKGFNETKYALLKLSKLAQKEDICPLIFPEGTRSKTGKLGKFYFAAFRILCKHTDLPVLSIALDGGYLFSRLYNVFNISSNIELKAKVLSLYNHPANKTEVDTLLNSIQKELDTQLSIWNKTE